MRTAFRKGLHSLMILSTSLSLTGVGLATSVHAGELQQASLTLGDARSGANTQHIIKFNAASTSNINRIRLEYTNTASSGLTAPPNFTSTSSTLTSVTVPGDDTSNWALDKTTNGILILNRATTGANLSSGSTVTLTVDGISNNTTTTTGTPLCDSIDDSDTCWLRIYTYTGTTTLVDQSTVTYTVINPITVSATIDPLLTFNVAGVANTSIATNDPNYGGSGTTVTSTATTVPFGNLAVGAARVGQQDLQILTNANNGYYVYHKFVGDDSGSAGGNGAGGGLMTGTYGSNNIDVFSYNSSVWATPQAWHAPDGTQNSRNGAWLGIRTTDYATGAGPNFNSAGVYAPPVVNSTTVLGSNAVMHKAGPDNGTSHIFVTYKIEANAFQASDVYTGTMVYNVVAIY